MASRGTVSGEWGDGGGDEEKQGMFDLPSMYTSPLVAYNTL